MHRHHGDGTALASSRRAPTALRVTLLLAAIAVLAFVAAPFGCALSDSNGSGGAPGQLCKQGDNAKCADKNVCHANICNADGVCETKNRVGDPPDPTPGDCHKTVCAGPNGDTPTTVVDPTDVDDDGNDCTKDTCDNGTPKHTPVDPGAKCKEQGHSGACNGSAKCEIPCTGGDDCSTTDACTIGACNLANNKCSFMHLDGVPPPGVKPVVGDCLDMTCVNGVTKEFADPADLPKVGACYTPTCVPTNNPMSPLMPGKNPKPSHAACMANNGSICDGMGKCVQCIDAGDCGTDGNLCHTPTCSNNGVCSFPNTPAGPSSTLNGMQVNGDCHQYQCDGNGGIVDNVDQSDPPNLGNPCINYGCDTNGNVTQQNKMDGTGCGSGLSCSNGNCNGCTMTSQCPSHPAEGCDAPNCDCPGGGKTLETCASQGLTCGTIADTGCGASANCNNGKNGQETDIDCGGPISACPTRCAQGQACLASSDCAGGKSCVDGFCCESTCTTSGCYACSNLLTGQANGLCRAIIAGHSAKSGCNSSPPCGDDGTCDGSGNCHKTTSGTSCGTMCSMASETVNQCNGTGSCMGVMTDPCSPYQCNSNGLVCLTTCGSDSDCIALNYCNSGVCGPLKGPGGTCTTGLQCSSNNCVDGVCCGVPSCGTCQTCNGSMPGTCTTAPAGDDPGTCDGTHSAGGCSSPPCRCDSGGNCVSGCGVDADCPNCQSCQSGTCTNVTEGTQTAGRCDDNNGGCGGMCSGCGNKCACDNANHCLLKPGQACTCDANCASGDCPNSSNCSDAASHNCN